MRVWWQDEELTEVEQNLLAHLMACHGASVFRPNMSSAAVVNSTVGARSYPAAIASALLAIGNIHGPIAQTIELLESPDPARTARLMIDAGNKVPGWGGSFMGAAGDPIWTTFEEFLRENYPTVAKLIDSITAAIHEAGKNIQPNPSVFTAATALILGIPPEAAPWLFVRGRLDGWSKLFLNHLGEAV